MLDIPVSKPRKPQPAHQKSYFVGSRDSDGRVPHGRSFRQHRINQWIDSDQKENREMTDESTEY